MAQVWLGVHSIGVHPDDSNWVLTGVSCGGVWLSTDGGDTWTNSAEGMYAAYMPPERKFDKNIQGPRPMGRVVAGDRKRSAFDVRLCRRRASNGREHRVVRARCERQAPHASRWQSGCRAHS